MNEVFDVRLEDFDALTRSYEPPTELRSADLVAVDTEQPFQTTVAETSRDCRKARCGGEETE